MAAVAEGGEEEEKEVEVEAAGASHASGREEDEEEVVEVVGAHATLRWLVGALLLPPREVLGCIEKGRSAPDEVSPEAVRPHTWRRGA